MSHIKAEYSLQSNLLQVNETSLLVITLLIHILILSKTILMKFEKFEIIE